jgi:hypothetical protein
MPNWSSEHAQDKYGEFGPQRFEISENVETASPGHRDIEYQQVPRMLPDLDENLFRVPGLTTLHALQVANQDLLSTPRAKA